MAKGGDSIEHFVLNLDYPFRLKFGGKIVAFERLRIRNAQTEK